MPIVRRSRRLSNQSPIAAEDYVFEDSFTQPSNLSVETIGLPSRHASLSSPHETKITVSDISTSLSPVLSHLLSFHNRSSHSRKKEEGHIPRPPNAFIVFRSCLWSNEDFRSLESDHRNVSRIAGERWRNLSDDEKEPFVQMAREAKALHAKMYPNYKYSPSHRSVAGSKRKLRRNSKEEKTKCDIIASFLQRGVEGSALGHAMSNVTSEDENEIIPTPILLPSAPMVIPGALTPFQSPGRRRRKKSVIRVTRTTTVQRRIADSNLATMNDLPLPVTSAFQRTDPDADALLTFEQFSGTTDLLYHFDTMDEFVPTDDIPPLSLDNVCDMKVAELDTPSIFPPGVKPAGGLTYFGSGLDVMPFGDSCFLSDVQFSATPPLIPMGNYESPLLSDYSSPLLTPTWSPVVFTNPWSTFLASCAPENELDKFFVQPIPAVPAPGSSDHTTPKYTLSGIDRTARDDQPEVNLDDWIHF
ncbi:hypothetical protein AZE42_04585 [Rhizopogon vesiculosus]|uniref:HMG box domain-containing protein n=2 Tax=Rhizopogon TaxID=5375 RepID=A0A1J8QI67_9AGAM|nr:hypothetical protein AZE42_04585 [Rhizopogon vesiculosus]